MRGYVALGWLPADAAASRAARAIRDRARREGYAELAKGPGFWAGSRGPNAPRAFAPRPGCLVVGEVFVHPQAAAPPGDAATDREVAAWFVRSRWGRYVILFRDGRGKLTSVFRDPSGALAAYAWRASGLQVVASGAPDWLTTLAPPPVDLDWARVRDLVESPFDLGGASPLRDLEMVAPGEFRILGGRAERLWSAEKIAAAAPFDARAARRELRERLDACVRALAGAAGRRAAGIEISGGLDSAIVAAALRETGGPIAMALNTRATEPETDERRFARAVAGRIGTPLTERLREEPPWTAEAFEATAGDPLPSQNGRDLGNDMTVAEACRAAGAEVLLTGKGGDALFFQMHTPLVFADLWRRRPARALTSPELPGVARWTRTSAWSVLRTARESRRTARPGEPPPAKRLQIAALDSGLAWHSVCRRSEVVDMIHPLTAQPLIEWALRTPVPVLVPGGRERGLARAVFADRLPALVVERRGKGDYAACFNRQAAANLPFLRNYLLDGRLAAEGVLDRSLMEARLDEDALRWRGGAAEILAAVSVEAWVRRWEARRAAA